MRLDEVIQHMIDICIIGVAPRRVGGVLEKLTKEERELLKTATAKDFNHRIK